MSRLSSWPWRYLLRRLARSHGFIDPESLLARLHRFAQPSEVGEPIELLRAAAVFHARGLVNSRVIQHNLDWVWPYWVERQFDPRDESFVPRAFSITHINLTHRNWTAIGHPDCGELPIVDPRGLLTPFFDGWSLDGWVLRGAGNCVLPSRARDVTQRIDLSDGVSITTVTRDADVTLISRSSVRVEGGTVRCRLELTASCAAEASLILALRPQNTEGVSFIHELALSPDRAAWTIDGTRRVEFSKPPRRHHLSDYRNGDVYIHLRDREDQTQGRCDVGLLTAAALFPVPAEGSTTVTATVELGSEGADAPDAWSELRATQCHLQCPDARYQFLYDVAVTSLVLHSPGDVYPGPYTYKRFWFRDAAFIIHALLCAGLTGRAARALARFPGRQTTLGYFRSQEGEWDSNGEALWIIDRYFAMTGRLMSPQWREPIQRGARWIMRKRLRDTDDVPHAGLLPAGFSAEHLGPNDYYYWDDFWGIAGLQAAAASMRRIGDNTDGEFTTAAAQFSAAVERSLQRCERRLGRPAMPASPYRRLDAGAIGSLVPGYPLQLYAPDDPRLIDTAEFLLERCLVKGAFFQDMIHAGLNVYLTLHIAQVLLRAGDSRYLELMDAVAALASPTGQWPEAIHPRTGGGCMGDGHHVWASAEWVLMVRHCFVREEGDRLILCAGVPRRWLDSANATLAFGPAPTTFGVVSIRVTRAGRQLRVEWDGDWHHAAPEIEVRLPGYAPVNPAAGSRSISLEMQAA